MGSGQLSMYVLYYCIPCLYEEKQPIQRINFPEDSPIRTLLWVLIFCI